MSASNERSVVMIELEEYQLANLDSENTATLQRQDLDGSVEVKSCERVEETQRDVRKHTLQYGIEDVPPWYSVILLGFQHYLTMLGGSIALPMIIAPALCITNDQLAKTEILNTMVFVSGLVTVLQTTVGVRLPIVQGATFTLIAPTYAIMSLPQWKCPSNADSGVMNVTDMVGGSNVTGVTTSEVSTVTWYGRMCEIQGAVVVSSLLQVVLGGTGLMGTLLYYIGPLAIAPTIALIGVSLFKDVADFCAVHWGIAILTVFLITIFSQYMHTLTVPVPGWSSRKRCYRARYPLFALFPVVLAIGLAWLVSGIVTMSGALPTNPAQPGYGARADAKVDAIRLAKWFRMPYPGQWGVPSVSVTGVCGMLAGVMAGIMESIGDYYACASLVNAPDPPVHAVNRGIFMEGVGCVLAGLWGSGAGTTSYTENIGVIAVTKVGSRRVVQVSGVIMMVFGSLGKLGGVFVSIPDPIIGGVSVVLFGVIGAIGVSNLQHTDMRSTRNLFIFGISLFVGLLLPTWINSHPGAITTGATAVDQILTVLLGTPMFVGGFLGFLFDNTMQGTAEERGIAVWRRHLTRTNKTSARGRDDDTSATYDIPCGMARLRRTAWTKHVPISPTFEGFNCRSSCRRQGQNQEEPSVAV